MYTNHPTVGILQDDDYTDLVKPYYDFFIENGVIHYSMNNLVSHLISLDIEKWWQYLSESKTFLEFRETLCASVKRKIYTIKLKTLIKCLL